MTNKKIGEKKVKEEKLEVKREERGVTKRRDDDEKEGKHTDGRK